MQGEEELRLVQEAEKLPTRDVERRLSAYYGPALPAHPLSEVAWLRLREQLSAPARSRRSRWRLAARAHARPRPPVPMELQHIYATLLLQANHRRPAPDLRCQFRRRPLQPRVSASTLGRGRISLLLPRENWRALQKAELDMLLAAGLARCNSVSRPLYLLPRVLFAASLLLVLAVLPFTSVDRRAVWIFVAAISCCLLSGRMLVWQQRVQAFRGDQLAVQWLGRERVCLGLRQLAERAQPRQLPTLGEPSLRERIARVCGTPISHKEKHLTLVG